MENLRLALFDNETNHGDMLARHLRRCQIGVERFADADDLGAHLPLGCYDVVVMAADVAQVLDAFESARGAGVAIPFIVLTDRGGDAPNTSMRDAVFLRRSADLPELLGAIEVLMHRQWIRIASRAYQQ